MGTETGDKHRSGASNVLMNLNIWKIIKMPKIYPKSDDRKKKSKIQKC